MAITIEIASFDSTPGGNPIGFVLNSTNVAQPNFKYVANVSINGNMVAKLKAFPNPLSGNRAVFNVQEIVRGFFDVTPRIGDGIIVAQPFECNNQIALLQVEFVEEYTGAPANSEESDVITVWNGSFNPLDFANYGYENYALYRITPDSSENALPLTNRPQSVRAISTPTYKQSGNIYFNCSITVEKNYDWVTYTYYSSDGNPYRNFGIKTPNWLPHNLIPVEQNDARMIGAPLLPLDVYNIPEYLTSDGISGSVDFPQFGGYYSVRASKEATNNFQSIEYFVYLNEDCSRFEPTEIHFENQLGGVDSYVFTKTNRETQTIERVQASKQYLDFNIINQYTIFGSPSNYSRFNAQVDFTRQYTVSSDWLTDAEFEWLQEMVRALRVWVRKAFMTEEGMREYLVPILITDTNYNVWKRDIDQLKTLSITYRYTFDEAMPL